MTKNDLETQRNNMEKQGFELASTQIQVDEYVSIDEVINILKFYSRNLAVGITVNMNGVIVQGYRKSQPSC